MRNLQRLSVGQRRIVFFLIVFGVLLLFVALAWLLIASAINPNTRQMSIALIPSVSVREFAALPDADAYPSTVAVSADGTVYTGSFASGAVWAIPSDGGTVLELPNTRANIGAVMGLAITPAGDLLIVDQNDTDPRTVGGVVWRWREGDVRFFAEIPDDRGFVAPNDITLDAQGRAYVTDSGRNEVWRFAPEGSGGAGGELFWTPPPLEDGLPVRQRAITGIAYDALNDALIITDAEAHEIYRVQVDDAAAESAVGERIYAHGDRATPPGFDGVTVSPDGVIYVAALGQNGIARVEDNDLAYIAGLFRGAVDVEFAAPNRLYVPNFDQASIVIPLVQPQLPFALDVVTLGEE